MNINILQKENQILNEQMLDVVVDYFSISPGSIRAWAERDLFPFYRDEQSSHNGYIIGALVNCLLGEGRLVEVGRRIYSEQPCREISVGKCKSRIKDICSLIECSILRGIDFFDGDCSEKDLRDVCVYWNICYHGESGKSNRGFYLGRMLDKLQDEGYILKYKLGKRNMVKFCD